MGKNQSASNLTNIIKQDANGGISFMSGSTMLMALSNTGQMSGSAPAASAVTASYADNFTVKGTLTAQTIVSQVVTSSTSLITGSTIFGRIIDNTHQFTGSVLVSGSIGVKNPNPDENLVVGSQTTNSSIKIYGDATGGDTYLKFAADSNQVKAQIKGTKLGANDGTLVFSTLQGGSVTDVMAVYSASVGIGTTTPNTKLQILGPLLDVGNQTKYALGIGNSSGYDLTLGTSASFAYIQSWTSKPLSINSQGNNVVFPNTSTNVSIGTATPSANGLTIYRDGGDRKIMLELNRPNTAGLQSAIQFTVGNSIMVGQIQHEYAASNQNHMSFSLRNPSGATIVPLWLQNSGNVGIGTTNPLKTLEVNGRMSTTAIVSNNLIAGNIATNMPSSPAYIPLFNLAEAAGFSLVGFVNAASYTNYNISQIYIRKEYSGSTVNAGITGLYKFNCDFSIVNITYSGATWIALRFTANPEIDVVWTGYLLSYAFNSDGSAQVWTSGVTLNSTYASY